MHQCLRGAVLGSGRLVGAGPGHPGRTPVHQPAPGPGQSGPRLVESRVGIWMGVGHLVAARSQARANPRRRRLSESARAGCCGGSRRQRGLASPGRVVGVYGAERPGGDAARVVPWLCCQCCGREWAPCARGAGAPAADRVAPPALTPCVGPRVRERWFALKCCEATQTGGFRFTRGCNVCVCVRVSIEKERSSRL